MIPIEAGSPFVPIGEGPSKTSSTFIVFFMIAILTASVIVMRGQVNFRNDSKKLNL